MHVKHHLLTEKKGLKNRRKRGPKKSTHSRSHSLTLSRACTLPSLLPPPRRLSPPPFALTLHISIPFPTAVTITPIILAQSPLILGCSESSPDSWQGQERW
ncbi:unnamed protein product [Urochloa humidicola]